MDEIQEGRSRAERRHQLEKAKARTRQKYKQHGVPYVPTPKQIGKQTAMHFTCACRTCTYKDPSVKPRYKGGALWVEREVRNEVTV